MKKELKNLLMPARPVIKTDSGHHIIKCCSSCAYKTYDNGAMRLCMKGCGHVPGMGLCDEWELNNCYSRLGKDKGRIKRPEYIKFLIACRHEENRRIMSGELDKNETRSLTSIREEFRAKFGKDIYLTN